MAGNTVLLKINSLKAIFIVTLPSDLGALWCSTKTLVWNEHILDNYFKRRLNYMIHKNICRKSVLCTVSIFEPHVLTLQNGGAFQEAIFVLL